MDFRNESDPYGKNKNLFLRYSVVFKKLNNELGEEYVEYVLNYIIENNRQDIYSPNYFPYLKIRHLFEKQKTKQEKIAKIKELEKEIGVGKTAPISTQESNFIPDRNKLNSLNTDLKNKYGD